MSIAGLVLDATLRHAAGRRVTHVQLVVGHLRQVVPGALEFAWELITRGTVAEGASLGIEAVEAVGACRACGAESPQPRFPFRCAECGGLDLDVVRGEELRIDWLDVETAETAPAEGAPEPAISHTDGGRT